MVTYSNSAYIGTLPIVCCSLHPVYFTAATVPPENVSAEQTDDQTVYVSWSAISSDRQPHVNSDITHYEVKCCSVGGTVQEPINVQTVASTSLTVMVLVACVCIPCMPLTVNLGLKWCTQALYYHISVSSFWMLKSMGYRLCQNSDVWPDIHILTVMCISEPIIYMYIMTHYMYMMTIIFIS